MINSGIWVGGVCAVVCVFYGCCNIVGVCLYTCETNACVFHLDFVCVCDYKGCKVQYVCFYIINIYL